MNSYSVASKNVLSQPAAFVTATHRVSRAVGLSCATEYRKDGSLAQCESTLIRVVPEHHPDHTGDQTRSGGMSRTCGMAVRPTTRTVVS